MSETPNVTQIPPGYLNDILGDPANSWSTRVSADESPWSLLGRATAERTSNTLDTIGALRGILLRVIVPADAPASPVNEALKAFNVAVPELKKYVVRIPEFSHAIPAPESLNADGKTNTPFDNILIDMHQEQFIFEAISTEVDSIEVQPGQEVWVRFGNSAALSDPQYLGPVEVGPTVAGSTVSAQGACRGQSQYGSDGAPGAPIGGRYVAPVTTAAGEPIAVTLGRQEAPAGTVGDNLLLYYLYERQLQFLEPLKEHWTKDNLKKYCQYAASNYGETEAEKKWLAEMVWGVMFGETDETYQPRGIFAASPSEPAGQKQTAYGMGQIITARFRGEKRIYGDSISWAHHDLLDPAMTINTIILSYKRLWKRNNGPPPEDSSQTGDWWAGPGAGATKTDQIKAKGPGVLVLDKDEGTENPPNAFTNPELLEEWKKVAEERPLPLYITYEQWKEKVPPTPENIYPNYGITPDQTAPEGLAGRGPAEGTNANVPGANTSIERPNTENPPPLPEGDTSNTADTGENPEETPQTAESAEPWTKVASVARVHIRGKNRGKGRSEWGVPKMVEYLHGMANVPGGENEPNGGGWWIGDVSHRGGGIQVGHQSHQSGIDVDITVPKKGGKMGGNMGAGTPENPQNFTFANVGVSQLDTEVCMAYFKYSLPYVKKIYFDQALINKCKTTGQEWVQQGKITQEEYVRIFRIVKHWPNHANHFHTRLSTPGIKDPQSKGRRDPNAPVLEQGQEPSTGAIRRGSPACGPGTVGGSNGRRRGGIGSSNLPPSRSANLTPRTTADKYREHIKAQKERMKEAMSRQPSLASKKGSHRGVNNIIVGGQPVATPFKVIRYDGTVPGFPQKIEGSGKAWWDPEFPQSTNRVALSRTRGGTNQGWYRKNETITHVTFHNYGNATAREFKPGYSIAATFAKRGFIGHFFIAPNGQICQAADMLCRTSHNAGKPLRTGTNGFSIGIDLGPGAHSHRVQGENLSETAVLPPEAGRIHLRRYNMNSWNRPTSVSVGKRATHEAAYALIKWFEGQTAIKHKYAFADARLDTTQLRESNVQAHSQLENNRIDGMTYIFWAGAYNKPGKVEIDF